MAEILHWGFTCGYVNMLIGYRRKINSSLAYSTRVVEGDPVTEALLALASLLPPPCHPVRYTAMMPPATGTVD